VLRARCPPEDGEACKYSWSRISALDIERSVKTPEPKSKNEIKD